MAEDIKNQLDNEKNKLMKLEIEMNAIDSDAYFYQKNNELDKLNELSEKKENLSIQLNSQKELVENLQSQYDALKSQNDEKQKEEFKKDQEKIIQDKLEKEKQEKINREKETKKEQKIVFKKKENKQTPHIEKKQTISQTSTHLVKKCPKCGAIDNESAKYCPQCGYQLKYGFSTVKKSKDDDSKDNGNWFVRLFLKKKKDDRTYRFSISKVIGSVYAILEFWTGLFSFYFPENIIIPLIAAGLVYLICLIIGYIVRWIYNKYIK